MNQLSIVFEIPGYDGDYGCDVDGNIYSKQIKGKGNRNEQSNEWKNLKLYSDQHGYLRLDTKHNGKRMCRFAQHLILETFVGPRPNGLVCCHADDDPKNNKLENLRWDTRKSNRKDAVNNGLIKTKLSTEDVATIRARYAAGEKQMDIAIDFKIDQSYVSIIINNKRWRDAS